MSNVRAGSPVSARTPRSVLGRARQAALALLPAVVVVACTPEESLRILATPDNADDAGVQPEGIDSGADAGTSDGAHGDIDASADGNTDAEVSGDRVGSEGHPDAGLVTLTVFDEAVFYDGYAELVDEPVAEGVQRLRNDLLTHRLSDAQLGSIGNSLRFQVVIGALCDNYDRLGSVALAFVPRGKETYVADEVERIEVGRFVTPFMDWNREPDRVSYEFEATNLASVLRDRELRTRYDLWLELELFGVPYAANTEIAGCEQRSDVFRGSLFIQSEDAGSPAQFDELIPMAYREPFNSYQQGASDRAGVTRKTLALDLDTDTEDTQLVLITSNHGAEAGGEEYSRRDHFVYVDDELVLSYVPGRASCEPFRVYNTQANGIYGSAARSDADWQSFSNWCPGDVIDTRFIRLGPMSAGSHEFVIDVPDAQFVGDTGDIPLSLYAQTAR